MRHKTTKAFVIRRIDIIKADVAQLVEQGFRKAQVGGSTPLVGFLIIRID